MFGLDDGLQYTDLTIAQGTGSNSSDTIISKGSEYLAILRGIDVSNINYYDFASTATGNQTLTGTSGNDVLLGAAGIDTVNSGLGSDVIITYGGDDVITIDGTGNKTIDGGTGTNTLSINYSGLTGLSDFTVGAVSTSDGANWTLTAANSDVITFKNIIDYTYTSGSAGYWDGYVTVASKIYRFVSDMRHDHSPFSGAYGSVQAFVYESGSSVEVVLTQGGKWLPQYRMGSYKGFTFVGRETF